MKIDHWIEQWLKTYEECYKKYSSQDNIYFISYEKICNSQEYWNEILQLLAIKDCYKYNFVESKKDFSVKDNNLLIKCYEIYNDLSKDIFKMAQD